MKQIIPLLMLCTAAAVMAPSFAADAQRQAEVARLGADVMPFSLKATTHVFTETDTGGVQQVVAKDAADAQQVKLIREHLREIRLQFLKGDFSAPAHIHGAEMPGLAVLEASRPGQIGIEYEDVEAGAKLTYGAADAKLVKALHQWFDAQLADHGSDATAGHPQHHDHGSMMKM
ncbi:MAG: hypothetical protein ACMG5Z_08805 [Luteimonas sp.]